MTHDRYPTGAIVGGKFRIERLLGRGGMGAVYAASHLALGQRVAIKVLMDDAASSAEATARFAQEARIVSALSSPHVVRVHDVGRSEWGEPFIVMELLEGRDLATLLVTPSPMPIAYAVDLLLQALVGVSVAHAAGLVHRDLKPANLFLARQPDRSEVVKVLDFGLSKVVRAGDSALTQSAASFGTPQYMAPEQIMSAKYVDARCDQHALAMILYELLTKRAAFNADTPAALTVTIVTKPAPSARVLRSDVPRALDEALLRAMSKKPADRYPDLGAFARALAPFGGPLASATASIVERTLASSTLGGARMTDGAFASDDLAAPTARTRFGNRLRSPLVFWSASAVIFTSAFVATVFCLTPRRGVVGGGTSSVVALEDPRDTEVASSPSAPSTPPLAITSGAAPSPVDSASSTPLPHASSDPHVAHKPLPSPRPLPTTAPTQVHDPNDPINVFGRSP